MTTEPLVHVETVAIRLVIFAEIVVVVAVVFLSSGGYSFHDHVVDGVGLLDITDKVLSEHSVVGLIHCEKVL